MSALDTVAEKAFDIVTQGASVSVTSSLGATIARAVPAGVDPSEYGPWSDQRIAQVYYESDPLTTAAVEIDFKIPYQISAAGQYIDRVYVNAVVACPTPFSLDATIEFRDVILDTSTGIDVTSIPFIVTVKRSHPVLGVIVAQAAGTLRGDGSSNFDTFYSIPA